MCLRLLLSTSCRGEIGPDILIRNSFQEVVLHAKATTGSVDDLLIAVIVHWFQVVHQQNVVGLHKAYNSIGDGCSPTNWYVVL